MYYDKYYELITKLLKIASTFLLMAGSADIDAQSKQNYMESAQSTINFATAALSTQITSTSTEPMATPENSGSPTSPVVEPVIVQPAPAANSGICNNKNEDNFIKWKDANGNYSVQFDHFAVLVTGNQATIDIPGPVINKEKYSDIQYSLLYQIMLPNNRHSSPQFFVTPNLPFTLTLPDEFLNQKVYFQLSVKYYCAEKLMGLPNGIKGNQSVVIIDLTKN